MSKAIVAALRRAAFMRHGNINVVLPPKNSPEFEDSIATPVAYRKFSELAWAAAELDLKPTYTSLTHNGGLAAIWTPPLHYAFIEVLGDGTMQALISYGDVETICWQVTAEDIPTTFDRLGAYLAN